MFDNMQGEMGVVIIATFMSIFFLLLFMMGFRSTEWEKVSSRLKKYTSTEQGTPSRGKGKLFRRKPDDVDEVLMGEKGEWKARLKNELFRADIILRAGEFLLFCFLGGGALGAILFLLSSKAFMFLVGLLVGAGVIPIFLIKRAQNRRVANFNQQLPTALSTMANSLRVGFSLFQAMKTLGDEMPPPISTEFRRTLQEINLGMQTDRALQNMCDRIKSDDLELVVMAIIIQRQVGGNLSEVLDNIAQTIMDRIKVKREIKTLTSQGRISGIIIGVLPLLLAVILYSINPVYMSAFFTDPVGYILLGMGLLSQLVGLILIRRIVNIDW
ncbi:MAG: secretion system protein [Firmicutes bacterium]|nr:secretion system protein [Bacillota bacterium]